MAHVSHRLSGPFAGALAAGGDPASSPLYVFGPFLRLLAVGAAGSVCFGAPIWMVLATVIVVASTYRKVMQWVTDGSGGSGLCEEELGSWAVKVNAAITVIEYTLTFLVSIAALVTFVADRFPVLAGYWPRTSLAVVLSLVTVFLVNRGPKMAARFFGPATLAVLALLWILVGTTIAKRGLHLPQVQVDAFLPANLHITLGGYVRLLALMTGIEVFANLVAAYDGSPRERARKAFGSLLIVMGTTLAAMLVLGPAIYAVADLERAEVSVFTQLMDYLLPAPLAYLGSLVGVFVLLSAAAASTQGLQNLSLGLRHRHYVPASFGQRNRFDVAARPAWIQAAVACALFIALGTHEETYLSLYAAGVFVLLSLTAFAAVKRLLRTARRAPTATLVVQLAGAALTCTVTTGAACLIFVERFHDGSWIYGVLIPILYFAFSRTRARLGPPTDIDERLGRILAERKMSVPSAIVAWPHRIQVFVDGSADAEVGLVSAVGLSARFQAPAHLCLVGKERALLAYGDQLGRLLVEVPSTDRPTALENLDTAEVAVRRAGADLAVAVAGTGGFERLPGLLSIPVLLIHASAEAAHRHTSFERLLVGLDGSPAAEVVLPYVRALMARGARITFALIPDGDGESTALARYGERLVGELAQEGNVDIVTTGSGPARTLVQLAESLDVDLVVVASHGRGGVARSGRVKLGSVPVSLLRTLRRPLLVIPSTTEPIGSTRVSTGVIRARE
ncbi:MAG: universal stress protein [Polyangiaceae bacterium]|nr:universal stress protein [Polyangiaceae bacterium]